MSLSLNHAVNTYLAVTLSPSSPYIASPEALASVHPSIVHVGQVGSMADVHVVSVPKFEWERAQEEVMSALKSAKGVGRVDLQEPVPRIKRGGDEL
ncbi:hypothetical protein BDZ94DRAFT_1265062 [Collybia nuda]|uniref:Uncharacterized protein n=1 Tax=Collybia nuda TaxID=64659 RepID=A0A9P5Y257_9AGAR|nr:hypothetical protein BDZ94DRAFT_1265062 [Collybia nuda]